MEEKDLLEVRETENKLVYEVIIKAGSYHHAHFEFSSPEEASAFLSIAAMHNVKGEDSVEISMKAKAKEEKGVA